MPTLFIEEGQCVNCGAKGTAYVNETFSYLRCWKCGLPYEIKVVRGPDGKLVVADEAQLKGQGHRRSSR